MVCKKIMHCVPKNILRIKICLYLPQNRKAGIQFSPYNIKTVLKMKKRVYKKVCIKKSAKILVGIKNVGFKFSRYKKKSAKIFVDKKKVGSKKVGKK